LQLNFLMKEEFIAYLWKNKLLFPAKLQTTEGEQLEVIQPGQKNHDAGPDFFAARIRIGTTLWAGNVEIHVKSSQWNQHGHQYNSAYDNTILHVVYEHDLEIKNTRNEPIPVLEIAGKFDAKLLLNYQALQASRAWVPCERQVSQVDSLILGNWLNRLLVERIERKSDDVLHFLKYFGNDWEQTFYYLLARNFGFKVNASPFGMLAQRTPHNLLVRNRNNLSAIEAILFGQAGLLDSDLHDVYPRSLRAEYLHQKNKYQLQPLEKKLWKFARIRPVNFPSIRIAQFAMLVYELGPLFRNIVETKNPQDIHQQFRVKTSPYWENHFVFDKISAKIPKKIGQEAVNNIITNTVAPVLFIYGKQSMRPELVDKALAILQETPAENNTIIRKWNGIGVKAQHAADSQALLELKKYYCLPKKCLQCPIGHFFLNRRES